MYISHVQNWYTEDRWIEYEEDGKAVTQKIRGDQMIIPAKLTVVTGSTLVKSRMQEANEALELFKAQAIDTEELLKKLDWPDWKQVLKRMQAGPFGAFFEKLLAMGAPEGLINLFEQVMQLDEKDFKRALEKGEIPPFETILEAIAQGGEGEPPPDPMQVVEVQVKQAETQKILAEIQLIREKIETERVMQDIKVDETDLKEEEVDIKEFAARSKAETDRIKARQSKQKGAS